jgi:hypothetical protein
MGTAFLLALVAFWLVSAGIRVRIARARYDRELGNALDLLQRDIELRERELEHLLAAGDRRGAAAVPDELETELQPELAPCIICQKETEAGVVCDVCFGEWTAEVESMPQPPKRPARNKPRHLRLVKE